MTERDVITYTAMIDAFAKKGYGKEAFKLFEQMQKEGIQPIEATFISVLDACSHSGLLEEGLSCLELMKQHPQCNILIVLLICLVEQDVCKKLKI